MQATWNNLRRFWDLTLGLDRIFAEGNRQTERHYVYSTSAWQHAVGWYVQGMEERKSFIHVSTWQIHIYCDVYVVWYGAAKR